MSAAPALIVLRPGDTVAIAARPVAAGEVLMVEGTPLRAVDPIPLGHKIALREMAAGDKVFRSGVPIGSATRPIAAGAHVHTQNLRSDYLPTYTLDDDASRFGRTAR